MEKGHECRSREALPRCPAPCPTLPGVDNQPVWAASETFKQEGTCHDAKNALVPVVFILYM